MGKGELQIYESVFVIFFFVIIFVIGFFLFYRFTIEDIRTDNFEFQDYKFKQLIGVIPSMYEVRCSFSLSDTECIDLSKAIAFKKVSKDYFNVFGYKRVSIKEVYPEEKNAIVIYEKVPSKYKTRREISSPVAIYDVTLDRFKVGKIILEWYY